MMDRHISKRRGIDDDSPSTVPSEQGYVALALVGFLLALFGTYWDDAWHTDRGRDSFLIPPHVCLYLGIMLAGSAVGLIAWSRARRDGRDALRHPGLMLAVVGVLVTLAAAPIDNAWHLAFGRDAVLWSPPHMLGVAGTLALAAGLLMLIVDGRAPRAMQFVGAAALLAVGSIPVLEYETDVPQFATMWFLPLLGFGSSLTLGLIRSMTGMRWGATGAAAVYTALRAMIAAVLVAASLPAPLLPLLMVPALAFDALANSGRGRDAIASIYALVLLAAYVPYLNWIKSDIYIGASDLVAAIPLTIILCYLGLWLSDQPRSAKGSWGRVVPRAGVVTWLLAALVLSGSASAHDPGQGKELGSAELIAVVDEEVATLSVRLPSNRCSTLQPVRAIGRRAGQEAEGPLRAVGDCRFSGELSLPERGRWFVYAEFEDDETAVETWLPVQVGDDREVSAATRSLYYPPDVADGWVKVPAGIIIYGLLVAVLAYLAWIARRVTGNPSDPERSR